MRNIIFLLGKILFKLFSLLPLKENTIILECDYGKGFYGNLLYIYNEMINQELSFNIIIPINRGKKINLKKSKNTRVIKTKSLKHIYYLATSRYWITNNHYYYFLKPRKETIFINTWHALGAFKKFGIDSAKNENDIKRFYNEGKNIDYLLVSSSKLRGIYSKALNVEEKKIISLGVPRTDPLFNNKYKEKVKKRFLHKVEMMKEKKVILYAPTFRDNEKKSFKLKLDLMKMKENLGSNYIVFLKLHPIIRNEVNIPKEVNNFVFDVKDENINNLMIVSDILITDYSSIVFEYSLLKKPIIFYAYDYYEYSKKMRGFYFEYLNFIPGPMVKTTEEVISIIKKNKFDINKIEQFSKKFCEFQDCNSAKRFIDYFFYNYKCI
ncbi:CDP-glycerol glycerophosphotransferase family protein [Clostridium botulinum]|uniref:CDP-glycerol glycerophosphotransferase family protein n=1 Tax=Clostridium botulinum TaxID=1491 RepID=UPI002237E535|nr:CDP-glycerol glycerophosphotransferase family protein [Clostridium botulinum]MCW6095804.1 CDP-glycerol glycerophosphotransferase family protein [Clostridium botulinum]